MRSIVVLGVWLIALFTLASAVSFGFYLHPYEHDANTPTYEIAHESTEAYAETIEREDLDTDVAIDVDALSPEAQRVFADATSQPWDGDASDWRTADADVCRDEMIVCDGLDAPPAFPDHASSSWDTYAVVEQGDQRYVVATRGPPNSPFTPSVALTAVVAIVFCPLLALVGLKYRDAPTTGVYGVTALGALIGLWPYLVMVAGIEAYWWLVVPLTCFGITVLVGQVTVLVRRAGDQHRARSSA